MLPSIVPLACLDAMSELAAAAPAGCFVEIGVYKGGSALRLYEIALRQDRTLHLFDTFAGMPIATSADRHQIGDFGDVDLDTIRAALPAAIFHVGVYPATHPPDLRDVAFIHCDCDQYDSYQAVIRTMYPLLVPHGVLLFDDYFDLPGARRAIEEHFPASRLIPTAGGRCYVKMPRSY